MLAILLANKGAGKTPASKTFLGALWLLEKEEMNQYNQQKKNKNKKRKRNEGDGDDAFDDMRLKMMG